MSSPKLHSKGVGSLDESLQLIAGEDRRSNPNTRPANRGVVCS